MQHSYGQQPELAEIHAYLTERVDFQKSTAAAEVEALLAEADQRWGSGLTIQAIEGFTLEFFMQRMAMDASRSAAHFTQGIQQSNHNAVLVALAQCFPDFAEQGLASIESPPRLYVSAALQQAYRQIAVSVGLGSKAVRSIPCAEAGCMDIKSLRKAIIEDAREGFTPFFIAANADVLGSNGIDPIKKMVAMGRVQGMWVHVDAPSGGLALCRDDLRQHLDGAGFADSVALGFPIPATALDLGQGLPADLKKELEANSDERADSGQVGKETSMFFCRHLRPLAKTSCQRTGSGLALFGLLALVGLNALQT